MADLVLIRSVHSLGEAEMIRALLDSEGIDAMVSGGGLRRPRIAGGRPAYQIYVRTGEAELAEEVLQSFADEPEGEP